MGGSGVSIVVNVNCCINHSSQNSDDNNLLLKPIAWCGRQWKDLAKPDGNSWTAKDVLKKIAVFVPLVLATLGSSFLGLMGLGVKMCKPACSQSTISTDSSTPMIQGSGRLAVKQIDLGSDPIKTIALHTGGNLYIKKGENNSLTITADDNLLDVLSPEGVNGGRLAFGTRPVSFSTHNNVQYQLTMVGSPNQLILSGSGNVDISRLDTDSFTCKISGSGDILIRGGSVSHQEVTISGSGNYDAKKLNVETSTINIKGSGNASVRSTKSLSATIKGSGNCNEYGTPQTSKKIAGSGRVRHR